MLSVTIKTLCWMPFSCLSWRHNKHSSFFMKVQIAKKFYSIEPTKRDWYFKDPLIFNDKRLLVPKYSGAASLEVLCPFIFLDPVLWSDQPLLYSIYTSFLDFNKHLQTWLRCVNLIYNIELKMKNFSHLLIINKAIKLIHLFFLN